MALKVLLITSCVMGKGDDQLGELLMANFLRLLGENQEKPTTMVFLNSGVRLVCDGSNVLDHVIKLEELGIEILACTTCLEYFDLADKPKVGKQTTMVKSIQSIMTADAVII
ncbi:sulfurtransferase-like selenium metabolism protein YedF [Chloroflexota bacterium]